MRTSSLEASEILAAHQPCEDCGSSDALTVYANGTHCFSCGKTTPAGKSKRNSAIPPGEPKALKARGIHEETCRHWGYLVGVVDGRPCHIAQYRDETTKQVVAAKLRFPDKEFTWVGKPKEAGLYGQWLWSAGGRMLVITEGEIDALSVSQANGMKYPVVSVPNGAKAAAKDIGKHLEWVSSFDRIVLWLDADLPGQTAIEDVASILPPGKVFVVKGQLKDANEYLVARRISDMTNLIWRAEPYRPDGIIPGSEIELSDLKKATSRGYSLPYQILSSKLHGLRKRELTTLTAGSGIGKSTMAREIAYHLHREHGLTIGNVYLEESTEKTAKGYIAIHNNVPLGALRENPDILDEHAWQSSLNEVVHQRMYFYDHFGSLDSDNLLSKLRYLAIGCQCDFIILDHISIVISGQDGSGEGERRDIDRLVTSLRSLIENTGVGVVCVCHLRRPGQRTSYNEGGRVTLQDLRGSASLEQLSDNVIALERDQQDSEKAHISLVRILKNREFGELGEADILEYNPETGRLLPWLGTEITATNDF